MFAIMAQYIITATTINGDMGNETSVYAYVWVSLIWNVMLYPSLMALG